MEWNGGGILSLWVSVYHANFICRRACDEARIWIKDVGRLYLAAESVQQTDLRIRNKLPTTNQTVDQTGRNKIHWGRVKFMVKSIMACYQFLEMRNELFPELVIGTLQPEAML